MMQFRITDGAKVLMMATVDLDAKQVIHLKLDEEDPIGTVYTALRILELHIEEGTSRWSINDPRATPAEWAMDAIEAGFGISLEPIESHPFWEQLAERFGPAEAWKDTLELAIGYRREALPIFTIEPQLTTQQMATAMGLTPCPHKAWILCNRCKEEWAQFIRNDEKPKRGWCEDCLPHALSEHIEEQASFDRLTEAEQPQQGGAQ